MASSYRDFFISTGFSILWVPFCVGELLMISNGRESDNTGDFTVSCVTDNVNAALIWMSATNDLESGNETGFIPPKSTSDWDWNDCAIWDVDHCDVEWRTVAILADSAQEPMGPVFDYRWEHLNGTQGHQFTEEAGYVYAGRIRNSSGSIVVSVRIITDDVHVYLCEGDDPNQSPCYWIKINTWRDQYSITECPKRIPSTLVNRGSCLQPRSVVKRKYVPARDIVGWKTYRIHRSAFRKTIEIFLDSETEPVFVAYFWDWYSTSHVAFNTPAFAPRIRFHFYKYILIEEKGRTLSTSEFVLHPSNNFCIDFFVGLCPDCRLNVSLANGDNRIEIGSVDGTENSMINDLVAWRPVRINATVQLSRYKGVRLEMRTLSKNGVPEGRWAIDGIRWCEPAGTFRISTVTENGNKDGWKYCQKLSYEENVIVARSREDVCDTNGFFKFLTGLTDICGSSCPNLGKLWTICNPTGCTCDRGFSGSKCDVECAHGHYGYGCDQRCDYCANRSCEKITGHCTAGCSDEKLLPPLCQTAGFEIRTGPSNVHHTLILVPENNSTDDSKVNKGDHSKADPEDDSKNSSESSPKENSENGGQNLVWLVTLPITLVCILLILIAYRHCGVPSSNRSSLSWITPGTGLVDSIECDGYLVPSVALHRRNRILPTITNLEDGSSHENFGSDSGSYDPKNHLVKSEHFKHYLEDGLGSGLLESQYEHVTSGPIKACEYGKELPNLAKNRSKDAIAYDETRVVLEKINEDPYSDYINANYIRGYRQTESYIATQGPTANTIDDFWRMVWQEKSTLICMLTNLMEDGEKLCEQYWPEVRTSSKHDSIVVTNAGEVEFADHVLRTFHVQHSEETREVKHLHYTGSWPSHGLLTHSPSLVIYLKKLLAIPSGNGLVVVHDSAGVGRTGVIILCDICLRQALRDKIINVPATTMRMREDRGNIVENKDHYLLAHVLISAILNADETQASHYVEVLY